MATKEEEETRYIEKPIGYAILDEHMMPLKTGKGVKVAKIYDTAQYARSALMSCDYENKSRCIIVSIFSRDKIYD